MGDLRGSLYDLFGYLMPGLFGSVGIALILWTLSAPTHGRIPIPSGGATLIFTAVILSYCMGHLIQAIGNLVKSLSGTDIDIALSVPVDAEAAGRPRGALLSGATLDVVNRTLTSKYGASFLALPPRDRFALIDEGRVLGEREGDREVYIYHHGFYRGMVIACSILTIGLLFRLVAGETCLITDRAVFCFGRLVTGGLVFLVLTATVAFWYRLKRFAEYRLVRAVMLWLTLTNFRNAND